MRICSACETEADSSGRFCPACGAAFATDAADPVGSTELGNEPGAAITAELSSSPAASLIGTKIDGFVIDAILGGGSFGTVFRGRQLGLDRPVAIKVPTHEIAADPVMARRFAREARSAAKITHPGVVAIYGVGELLDGRPYLAMQLIDGEPLDRIVEGGPVPVLRALAITRQIASALADTHAANVIHRDLKPSNIVWRRDRLGDDRITIVDFGIAVAKPGNADATRLTTGGVIGTPHYMSPEQAHGDEIDHRADLYALGCILFEMLTGTPPFDGSGFEVLLAHLGRPIPTPSDRNAEIPELVDKLTRMLMAKKPEGRPATADELVVQIDKLLAQLAGRTGLGMSLAKTFRTKRKTQQPTVNERPEQAPVARKRTRLIAFAAIGIVALAGAGFAAYKLTNGTGAAIASGDAAADPDPSNPASASPFTGRRTVISDDGEITSRTTLYDPIVAGTRVRTMFEMWNAIGAPLEASQLVVTLEGPDGKATGVTATPSKQTKGRFAFHHVFAAPGHYVLRVFPPEAHTVFAIDLDVTAP